MSKIDASNKKSIQMNAAAVVDNVSQKEYRNGRGGLIGCFGNLGRRRA
jgi:hypothetical protein